LFNALSFQYIPHPKVLLFIAIPFILCQCKSPEKQVQTAVPKQKFYTLKSPATIGTTDVGQQLFLGGFSSLVYKGKTESGEFEFYTITDRGPNAYTMADSKVSDIAKPFLLPAFNPEIIIIRTDSKNMNLEIVSRIPLKYDDTKLMTGLPNIEKTKATAGDEYPVNNHGKPLEFDLMGIDSEGLTLDPEGNFWVCDEYRPSILKFSKDGVLIKRFVPANFKGSDPKLSKTLPAIYGERQLNRGFEGLTYRNGKILAVMQSPLNIKKDKNKNVVRILEFDLKTEKPSGDYMILLADKQIDKIGDINVFNDDLIYILQNGQVGENGYHRIFRIRQMTAIKGQPEKSNLDKLTASYQAPIEILDLKAAGFDMEKTEGLAPIDANTMAVINDNDFGLNGGIDRQKGTVPMAPDRSTVLAIISL
jgi:3-phytase